MKSVLTPVPASTTTPVEINGDTPTMRLFALLEVIASKDQFFSLQGLAEETGTPKPTLHRMLQQLENAGLLERGADSRQYGTGVRLRKLAENLLLKDTFHGARHGVDFGFGDVGAGKGQEGWFHKQKMPPALAWRAQAAIIFIAKASRPRRRRRRPALSEWPACGPARRPHSGSA